jgi:hypothetical protein
VATFNHISGAEPSTVTFKAATVSMTRNSSVMHQEIISLGDPDSSLAISAVLNAQPASTAWGLVTRPVISSVGGVVAIQGNSTVFQGGAPWSVSQVAGSTWSVRAQNSSAGDLQATVAQASTVWAVQLTQYSTTVNVSSLAGKVLVDQNSTVWAVQMTQYSTIVAVSSLGGRVQVAPSDTSWASSAGFHFTSSGELQISGTFSASTVVTVSQLLDSSGGSVTAADSANNAIRVNVVAGAAGGSTIVTVSTGSVRVQQSSAVDLQATVAQASTTWAVQLSQYSTTVNVSSLAGKVLVDQNSTVWQVQINGNSTVTLDTSLQSTTTPSSNSSGLVVRQALPHIFTTASSNAFASTTLAIQSSAANTRIYVTAYSILTTSAGPTALSFRSSGTLVWPLILAAVSSAISGANLAVSYPSYLFRTVGGSDALNLHTQGSTGGGFRVGVSYFKSS